MSVSYDEYTDERFATVEDFQKFLNSGKTLKYDFVIVAGILYTMHEYDMDGLTVTWANKKHNSMLEVSTSNRYSDTGYSDAKVNLYQPAMYLREDINYAE